VRGLKQLTTAQKWVAVLGVLAFLLGLGNLGQAVMALRYAARLPDVPTTVSLKYLAAMGGFWGVVFIVSTVGLSSFLPWGRWLTLAAVTLHQAHVWSTRLLLDASDYARQTYPRDLALTLMLLLLYWGSLNLPAITRAFGRDIG
jgi:hypothetical protein